MCAVNVFMPSQGPEPWTHGKMAKPSLLRLREMAKSSFGPRADVDGVQKMFTIAFSSRNVPLKRLLLLRLAKPYLCSAV